MRNMRQRKLIVGLDSGVLWIFAILLLMYLYMYVNTTYELSFGSNYGYYQVWRLDYRTVALRYCTLLLLLGTSYKYYKQSNMIGKSNWFIGFVCLFLLLSFWFCEALLSSSIQAMLYSVTSPLVYMTAIALFIGTSENGFNCFAKLCMPISLILIVVSAVSYLSFLSTHPLGLLADSSALTLYVNGFWLFAIGMVYNRANEKKIIHIVTWVALFVLVVLAILFNARSWVMQSALLVLLNIYIKSSKSKIKTVIKIAIMVTVISLIAFYVMKEYFPNAWEYMQLKMNKDTRSGQYDDLISQVSFFQLLIGQGYHFVYENGLKHEYAYIDNSFLFMLVRYGIVVFFLYYIPYLYSLKALITSRVDKETRYYAFIVLMWLAALGGLSIFCVITIDIKSIAMPILAGRCIAGIKRRNQMKINVNEVG